MLLIGGGVMEIYLMLLQYPNQHIVRRGWQILTPHEDKDDDYDDGDGDGYDDDYDDDDDDDGDGDDDDHDDCKCGATSGLGRTCFYWIFEPWFLRFKDCAPPVNWEDTARLEISKTYIKSYIQVDIRTGHPT